MALRALLFGKSMDSHSDKREAARLLRDLKLLRSSEPSLLRATMTSSRDDADDSDKKVRFKLVGTIAIQVTQMRVAAELTAVMTRIFDMENITVFKLRNPKTVHQIDILVKFTQIILDNDAVSVVPPTRTNWVTSLWDWIFGIN